MEKLFWFDLDGTLRKTISGGTFINNPRDQQPIKGAAEAVEYLNFTGFKVVGVTNQGGCAALDPTTKKPRKSIDDAIKEQRFTLELFPGLESIYFCPTYDKDSYCYWVRRDKEPEILRAPIDNAGMVISCRKPGHGMLLLSSAGNATDWANSWMVGDRYEDQLCAAGAGVNFIWANYFLMGFGGEPCKPPPKNTQVFQKVQQLMKGKSNA